MTATLTGGLCAEVDPELWFPENGSPAHDAKATCARCDIKEDCLTEALADPGLEGVWGGLSKRERQNLRRTLRRGDR